jgi:hypothetical protein
MKRHGSNVASSSQLWSGLVHSSTAILLQPALTRDGPWWSGPPRDPPFFRKAGCPGIGRVARAQACAAGKCGWESPVPKIKILA